MRPRHLKRLAERGRPAMHVAVVMLGFLWRQGRHRTVTGADSAEHATEEHRSPIDVMRQRRCASRCEVRIRAREVEPQLEHPRPSVTGSKPGHNAVPCGAGSQTHRLVTWAFRGVAANGMLLG